MADKLPENKKKWQETALKLMRRPLLHRLMVLGINFLVPRQRIGTSLVAFDEHDRVLMLRHVFHPFSPWGLPGGWLKRNEDPAVGVLRELREETGLTAVLGPVVCVAHEPYPIHIGIAYLGQIQPGQISLSNEIIESAWFDVDQLPSPLLPFVHSAIHAGLSLNQWWRETAVSSANVSFTRAEE